MREALSRVWQALEAWGGEQPRSFIAPRHRGRIATSGISPWPAQPATRPWGAARRGSSGTPRCRPGQRHLSGTRPQSTPPGGRSTIGCAGCSRRYALGPEGERSGPARGLASPRPTPRVPWAWGSWPAPPDGALQCWDPAAGQMPSTPDVRLRKGGRGAFLPRAKAGSCGGSMDPASHDPVTCDLAGPFR